jgi:hypothetical protein
MKHFIYKTTHTNGKYYIGRHSTEDTDDGYIGSGKWPSSIKDKTTVTREILEYATDNLHLKELERGYLNEHFGKLECMNMTPDPIGFDTENNPMRRPEVAEKLSGVNHWTIKNPEKVLKGESHWMNTNPKAKEHFLKTNPVLDGRNAWLAIERGRNVFINNNPSIWRSEQGIHHWQNGNAPNTDGALNKKLIEEGTHNFLGPELNNRRIAEGTHNFTGSKSNLKRLAEGRHPSQQKKTCEHCGKISSVGMYTRWHGARCKLKE